MGGNVEKPQIREQRRKFARVAFEAGYPARIMGIDGTWFRDCRIDDISQTGAKLAIAGDVAGLNLQEFFLALSRTGESHRRCEKIWLTGDMLGVRFLAPKPIPPRRWSGRPK